MHIIWYTALWKARSGRARETTKDPAGLLPHAGGKGARQGLAERVGQG